MLGRPAAEVAETLATTPAAVNSGCNGSAPGWARSPSGRSRSPSRRTRTGGRWWTGTRPCFADVDALTRLLTADGVLEMPPVLNWYVGRERYGRFIARAFAMRGTDWRMLPTAANGQPALAA